MRILLVLLLVAAAGCNYASPVSATPRAFEAFSPPSRVANPRAFTNGKISHVVIIVQENRSVDNLFQGLKGADTQSYGLNSAGDQITLLPVPFSAPYDLNHDHSGYAVESDSGKMDGFNLEHSTNCTGLKDCPKADAAAYGYLPQNEVAPYFDMAEQYAFSDHMFAK